MLWKDSDAKLLYRLKRRQK